MYVLCTYMHICTQVPGAVAESLEHRTHVQEIGSSVPGRGKPMIYRIDTCHFLAWHSTLGQGLVSSVSR